MEEENEAPAFHMSGSVRQNTCMLKEKASNRACEADVMDVMIEESSCIVRSEPRGTRSTTEVDALVGVKVKIRRTEMSLSQEKLASKLRITAQQLQKYERGTNRIGASRLFEIANILDVPVQYFFEEIVINNQERSDDTVTHGDLMTALEDASTVKLLRLFAEVRDPALKSRVVSLVEAVVRT